MGGAILLIQLILSDSPFSRGIAMLCLYHSVADIGRRTLRPEQHYMRMPHFGGELKSEDAGNPHYGTDQTRPPYGLNMQDVRTVFPYAD